MEVINKPEVQEGDFPGDKNLPATTPPPPKEPNNPGNKTKRKEWPRPKWSKRARFFMSAAFVLVTTMFVVMCILSALSLVVVSNQPYLAANIQDDVLHQDKVYIQFEGETFYRELIVIRDRIADPEDREVTQIPVGQKFKLIFTPKQLDIPENYKIIYRDITKDNDNVTLGTLFDRKVGRDKEGGFDTLTVFTKNGTLSAGKYVLDFPDGGMFGGQLYAFFNVYDPAQKS